MDVQFNEEDQVLAHRKPEPKVSLFTRIVYKLKLANTEAGAQRIMLIAAGVFLGAAILVFLNLAGII